MPIYDYRCTGCGAEFEQLVRSSLERLVSLPARPVSGGKQPNYSRLGPPPGGTCCGGSCQSHSH